MGATRNEQVAELQQQFNELQKKDRIAVLTKRVAELEAHLTEAIGALRPTIHVQRQR